MILKGPKKETRFSLPSKVNKIVQVTWRTCTLATLGTMGHASWATTQAAGERSCSQAGSTQEPDPHLLLHGLHLLRHQTFRLQVFSHLVNVLQPWLIGLEILQRTKTMSRTHNSNPKEEHRYSWTMAWIHKFLSNRYPIRSFSTPLQWPKSENPACCYWGS